MKKLVYIALFSVVIFFCHGCFQVESKSELSNSQSLFNLQSIDDLYEFLTYNDQRYPLVSAHRGGAVDQYPENAIETFAYHAKKHPIIIECDVQLTKDSVLILMHDETLDRTTTGSGRISRLTYEEIEPLYLKNNNGESTNYRIPKLEDALRWGKGKVIYTLDVKKNVPYSLVVEYIKKAGAESNTIIITYSAAQAAQVHSLAPDLMLSANIKNSSDLGRLASYNIPDNRIVAFVGSKLPSKELIDQLHAHGIMIILGASGNLDRRATQSGYQTYAELINSGVDILSTDDPQNAQKALDFYIQKRKLSSPYIK